MATYKVTGPDGAVYKIDAPDDNVLNEAVDQLFSEQAAAPAGPTGTNGADPMAPEIGRASCRERVSSPV